MRISEYIPLIMVTAVLFFTSPPATAVAGGLGDMVFDDKLDSMREAGVGPVVFPHTRHEEIYKCEKCHPSIFKKKRGANDISMKENMEGRFCGTPSCHDSIGAFPLYMCANCHTDVRQP